MNLTTKPARLALTGGVLALTAGLAWAWPGASQASDPVQSAPVAAASGLPRATADIGPTSLHWLTEAEDEWDAGNDSPRLAEIHSAIEYVGQERGIWEPVTQELGDALAEGEYEGVQDAVAYDWEACAVAHLTVARDSQTVIVCEDGLVVVT